MALRQRQRTGSLEGSYSYKHNNVQTWRNAGKDQTWAVLPSCLMCCDSLEPTESCSLFSLCAQVQGYLDCSGPTCPLCQEKNQPTSMRTRDEHHQSDHQLHSSELPSNSIQNLPNLVTSLLGPPATYSCKFYLPATDHRGPFRGAPAVERRSMFGQEGR